MGGIISFLCCQDDSTVTYAPILESKKKENMKESKRQTTAEPWTGWDYHQII